MKYRYSQRGNYSLLLSFIFFLISAGFCLGAVLAYNNAVYFIKNGIVTVAKIVDIQTISHDDDESHVVTVEYFVDKTRYEAKLGYYTSSMRENDIITIRYLKDAPHKIKYAKNEFLAAYIFFALAALFLILSCVFTIILIRKKSLVKLIRSGNKTTMLINEIKVNLKIIVNGKSPYKLVCREKNTDEDFYSENLYLPEGLFQIGDEIDVYFDSFNKERYYVDIKSYLDKAKNKL